MEPVRVRLGKKDCFLDSSVKGRRLIRITNSPLSAGRLLVWRMERGTLPSGRDTIRVYHAKQEGNGIKEGFEIASLIYDTYGRSASVYHFEVKPSFRRQTLGTALRETMLRELKRKDIEYVKFPPHYEEEFYTRRGFEKISGAYAGVAKQLGVRTKGIKLKVLWQKPLR